MGVAERVVDRDQLDLRLLAPRARIARVNDRPIRPNPLMPTRTAMLRLLSLNRAAAARTTAEPPARPPVSADRGPRRPAPQGRAATGSHARAPARQSRSTGEAVVGIVEEHVDPPPWSRSAASWSVPSSPASRSSGRRFATWTTRPGAAVDRRPDVGHAEHRQRCSCRASRAPARSGRPPRSPPARRAGRGVGGHELDASDRARSPCRRLDRDLADHGSPPMSALIVTGVGVAGTTCPTDAEQTARPRRARQ